MPRSLARPPDEPTLARLAALSPSRAAGASEWRFTLRTLTPVLGGGVRAWEPDPIDVVRAPGIRGQLRGWWRLLYAEPNEDAEALFRREAELWGGVEVPGLGAVRSRVGLRVEILEASKPEPAGKHHADRNGNGFSAAPEWKVGEELGYALFPLQLPEAERNAARGTSALSLDTRSLRRTIRFALSIRVDPRRGARDADPQDLRQVLGALWAWTHLGGLGARTRRGFGATGVDPMPAASLPAGWSAIFEPLQGAERLDERVIARLAAFATLAGVAPTSALARASLLVLPSGLSADQAHKELVSSLKRFRQGEEIGRDPGKPGGPRLKLGESRWPEPHLLRIRVGDKRWAHPPTQKARDAHAAGRLTAPRAAFGLPIQVQFQSGDTDANSTLKPMVNGEPRERWASPVLLRPFPLAGGKALPLVLILRDRPQEVGIFAGLKNEQAPARGTARVLSDGSGAREAITQHLGGGKQPRDGAGAFADALKSGALDASRAYRFYAFPAAKVGGTP